MYDDNLSGWCSVRIIRVINSHKTPRTRSWTVPSQRGYNVANDVPTRGDVSGGYVVKLKDEKTLSCPVKSSSKLITWSFLSLMESKSYKPVRQPSVRLMWCFSSRILSAEFLKFTESFQ